MPPTRIKVLLVSKRTDDSLKLRDNLARNPGYSVHFEETAQAAMSLITEGRLDCLVFNFENFTCQQVNLLEGLRKISPKLFQILLFTQKADPDATQAVRGLPNLIVIEKPLLNLDRDVTGLCERLIGGDHISQREHPRHTTSQKASIERSQTGKVYEGVVIDISQKGACIELPVTLTVGEIVKVTVDLNKLQRHRTFNAEVRWARFVNGRGMAGLRFL